MPTRGPWRLFIPNRHFCYWVTFAVARWRNPNIKAGPLAFLQSILCFGMVVFVLMCGEILAQQKTRTLDDEITYPSQPIVVIGREVDGREILSGNKVMGDRDWLKRLSLEIKNVSDKNIRSFDVRLLIKRQGLVVIGIPIYFRTYSKGGQDNALTPGRLKKIGVLRPGESVRVKVRDAEYSAFGDELRKQGLDDIDRVNIEIRAVYFEDGSRWVLGQQIASASEFRSSSKPSRKWLGSHKASQVYSFTFLAFLIPSYQSIDFFLPANSRLFYSKALPSPAPSPPPCVWHIPSERERNN